MHVYLDPNTGFQVFTALGLKARGRCCGAGCRHCPYHHAAIPNAQRPAKVSQPAWLTDARPSDARTTVLFWSGGKDSFLAYRALNHSNLVLLTTFDKGSTVIAHQELKITDIIAQAEHLDLPLVGIPLHPDRAYEDHIADGLALIPNANTLAFGDLHLEHIRNWREETFARHPATSHLELSFPLWHRPYQELLQEG